MAKKILELCLSPDLGGLELFMVSCYNYFKTKTNCKIVVAPNKKLDDYLKDKILIKRNKFFPFIPALKLAQVIDKNSIDIVHFHWTKDMPTIILAKLLSKKKPKVVQTRNMHITRFKSDFYHKFLYKNINIIHSVTKEVKKQLIKYIPNDIRPQIEHIYMGVKKVKIDENKIKKLQKKYNLSQDDFVVGIIGRIEEAKGQRVLIEAISKLNKFNIKALIVGHTMNKGYLKSLKDLVKRLNIEDKIIFTGFTKEAPTHFLLCNTTVLATKNETFGLVVVESMIQKVPVIATNRGGPKEIIDDKKDGLLFDRSSDDLAKKISLLYHDKNFLKELSQNAYKKAIEKFEYNKQLEKLYKVLVDES
jgi:glycosyltransferase involved in cell wall biosynthesis